MTQSTGKLKIDLLAQTPMVVNHSYKTTYHAICLSNSRIHVVKQFIRFCLTLTLQMSSWKGHSFKNSATYSTNVIMVFTQFSNEGYLMHLLSGAPGVEMFRAQWKRVILSGFIFSYFCCNWLWLNEAISQRVDIEAFFSEHLVKAFDTACTPLMCWPSVYN